MLEIIGITIVVSIVALLVYAATKPGTFRIQRSAIVNAPAEKIFAYINDFHQWTAWSPWEKCDPKFLW